MRTNTWVNPQACWLAAAVLACAAGCGKGYEDRLETTLKDMQEAKYKAMEVDYSDSEGGQESKPAPEPAAQLQGERWTPDPGVLSQLGTEVRVGDFMFRPPAGYQQVDMPDLPEGVDFDLQTWQGESRADGSLPVVIVLFAGVPEEQADATADPQAMQMYLDSASQQFENWSVDGIEQGYVDKLQLVRARYSAVGGPTPVNSTALTRDLPEAGEDSPSDVEPAPSASIKGIVYMAIVGGKMIAVMSQDAAEHADETEPVHKASALTLRPA